MNNKNSSFSIINDTNDYNFSIKHINILKYLSSLLNSDLTSIQKQAYFCLYIEDEEKYLDKILSIYKDYLFENKLLNTDINKKDISTNKYNLEEEENERIQSQTKTSKLNYTLINYSIKREYFELFKHFKIWKKLSSHNFKSFEEIIDEYTNTRSQLDDLIVDHSTKKNNYAKELLNYYSSKQKYCNTCKVSCEYNEIDNLSVDLNELVDNSINFIDENSELNDDTTKINIKLNNEIYKENDSNNIKKVCDIKDIDNFNYLPGNNIIEKISNLESNIDSLKNMIEIENNKYNKMKERKSKLKNELLKN